MRFLSALVLAASTGLFQGALAATKIMALGDSITGSPGCWRALLWQQLTTNGYTDIDFVGTLPAQGCGFTYDGENEGHGGYLATNIADQNMLPAWLTATNPNIVIMHLGTNDVWSSKAPSVILTSFSKLVDQMRANNPNMKILVAKIIPMAPPTCTECGQRVIDFNAAIATWAPTKSTTASPITVVDQWTGFVTGTDTYDGVHPNSAGDIKVSAKWYGPLVAALTGTTPISPPVSSTTKAVSTTTTLPVSSTTRTTTASPTPTSGGTLVNAWGQCGGIGWTGGTACVSGYTCKVSNPYYSQCLA